MTGEEGTNILPPFHGPGRWASAVCVAASCGGRQAATEGSVCTPEAKRPRVLSGFLQKALQPKVGVLVVVSWWWSREYTSRTLEV